MSNESVWDSVMPDEVVTGVPVFRPSYEQFADFEKYMQSINRFGMQSGIVKVVPPAKWVDELPSITNEKLMSIKIKNPIVQHINGGSGVFSQQNIEKQRTFNIVQWKSLSEQQNYQPPAPRGQNRKTDPQKEKINRKILANKNHNDEALFKEFEYNIDTSEYTPERCDALEKAYWKGLTYAEPMYGGDMLGSIFDSSVKVWNVASLPNLLDHMEDKLPGVNEAYLYAGLWKATFSWHLEDQDLYSINYLHFGAPKQWYSIPQKYKDKFDALMRDLFPQDYQNCPDFLRHKTFLVSPTFLESKGIAVNRIVHREKEFMITYPYGYHAGMNYGYNLAESVNFAIEEWFEYGFNTSKCLCVSDSVGIDVHKLLRRFKGEPESIPGSPEGPDAQPLPSIKSGEENVVETVPCGVKGHKRRSASEPKKSVKKCKTEEKPSKCLLCPNVLSKKQLRHDSFAIIPKQGRNEQLFHRLCAEMIPEISIIENGDGKRVVVGFENIPSARKSLKCVFCHEKKGACFQCYHPKCTRSFHGTCSLPAGVYFDSDFHAYCKIHRPQNSNLHEYAGTLKIGDLIQAKFDDFFSGVVVSNNRTEESVTIDLYPQNGPTNLIEVPYSSLYEQAVRFAAKPKLEKKEKPNKDENEEIIFLNLQDNLLYSNEIEEIDGRTWAKEFIKKIENCSGRPEMDHIWYYKPLVSTEQVARYADDITQEKPNDPYTLKKQLAIDKKKKKVMMKNQRISTVSPGTLMSCSKASQINENQVSHEKKDLSHHFYHYGPQFQISDSDITFKSDTHFTLSPTKDLNSHLPSQKRPSPSLEDLHNNSNSVKPLQAYQISEKQPDSSVSFGVNSRSLEQNKIDIVRQKFLSSQQHQYNTSYQQPIHNAPGNP